MILVELRILDIKEITCFEGEKYHQISKSKNHVFLEDLVRGQSSKPLKSHPPGLPDRLPVARADDAARDDVALVTCAQA